MIEQFDVVDATFQPIKIDDLKPGVAAFIGHRDNWEAMWMIDEEDGGSYVGQWAFGLYRFQQLKEPPPFTWVPECDLEIHALSKEERTE